MAPGEDEPGDAGRAERLVRRAFAQADGWALFLDIDGTLLDIAAQPDAVSVPDGLRESLTAAHQLFDGAVALVTGRTCGWVADRLAPLHLPVAGLHGAQRRTASGQVTSVQRPAALDPARAALAGAGAAGFLVEDKGPAIALHYRGAPELQPEAERIMADVHALVGNGWTLQRGKMVIELRPAGADKGEAMAEFLAEDPFLGRRPLAVGDDLTDEAMFIRAVEADGAAIRVGNADRPTAAAAHLPSPDALRRLLGEAVHWVA